MVHKDAPHTSSEEMERIKLWVRHNVHGAVLEERTYHGQLRFSVPNGPVKLADSASTDSSVEEKKSEDITTSATAQRGISSLFNLMESNRDELAFAYYAVQPTTLDQIFLKVVGMHNIAEENYATDHRGDVISMRRKLVALMRRIIDDA